MFWSWPHRAQLVPCIVVHVEEGSECRLANDEPVPEPVPEPLPEPVEELGVVTKEPVRTNGHASNDRYGLNERAARIVALLDEHRPAATWAAARARGRFSQALATPD